ncbi:MAG: hypothetical protein ABIH23_06050 [bacterium]
MTKRDVINMALDYLNIEAVDSDSNERLNITKKANRWYDTAALFVLKLHDWFEAIAHTTLTTEASITNVWDDTFGYVYALPSGCLRVMALDLDSNAKYIVEGSYLYTNYYDAASGVDCQYLKDIREESNNSLLYSDMLGEAIAARLAYNLAPIADKGTFRAIFDDIIQDAIEDDKQSSRWSAGHENPYWTDIDRGE